MLTKLMILSTQLLAGPGEGHSHGPIGLHGTQWIGLGLIVLIGGVIFWFLSKRK